MRTTVRLNEHLLSEARHFARETGRTLTSLIEEGLRQILHMRKKAPAKHRVRLTTFKGKGLQPGVDLDHTAELLDLMEDRG